MIGADVSPALRAGWNESRAVIRNGCSGVEFAAASPPSELVMSAATMRPPWSQGSVKSSSVISATWSAHAGRADAAAERARGVVDEVGLRLGDAVVAAGQAAAGHEHRVPRRRAAHLVGPRVTPLAARRVAEQAAAAADPCEALGVDVDVVGVVGQAVVAAEVDRLGEGLRMRRVAQVGHPDRAAVAAAAGVNGPRSGEVVAPRRAAGPHVPAVLDAARRVPGRQLDEVADLLQIRRVGVGDHVEARAAFRVAGLGAERARCPGS